MSPLFALLQIHAYFPEGLTAYSGFRFKASTKLDALGCRSVDVPTNEAPSLAIVYNWFNELDRGRTDPTDDLREGRPSTATSEGNISSVLLMIETDERVTYQQIGSNLSIGMSQVQKILHEYLAVKKLSVYTS
ncbi:Putative uncharacterized protein FLJ37770 [Eumeta japonica]|uniref:Uncharacterized protein n=1 Tax=Eumeta variegata TaxID=151549 RepID=A0A4C1SHL3_EUMVA|nr:Putative uncharacterized protein FLJ37770 [Eumeta japonica]